MAHVVPKQKQIWKQKSRDRWDPFRQRKRGTQIPRSQTARTRRHNPKPRTTAPIRSAGIIQARWKNTSQNRVRRRLPLHRERSSHHRRCEVHHHQKASCVRPQKEAPPEKISRYKFLRNLTPIP